jgi:signal transduction histidine kinase
MGGAALNGEWTAAVLFGGLCAAACLVLVFARISSAGALRNIIEALRDIADGNRNRRVHVRAPDKRLNELALLLNRILDEWARSAETADRSERIRKRLIADISHDIRTPLTSILGYVDAIRNEPSLTGEEKAFYLQIVANKGNDLLMTINNFFMLARIEAGETGVAKEPVLLNELVKEELLSFYHEIADAGLQPEISITDEPLYVAADPMSLRRIVANLISNAVRYGHEGGVIGLRLSRAGSDAELTVWDRGRGVAEDDLPHIFDRLYTGEKSRNRKLRGTGLGLTIVRRLVENLGGTISASSKPYEYTAFVCTLPIELRKK